MGNDDAIIIETEDTIIAVEPDDTTSARELELIQVALEAASNNGEFFRVSRVPAGSVDEAQPSATYGNSEDLFLNLNRTSEFNPRFYNLETAYGDISGLDEAEQRANRSRAASAAASAAAAANAAERERLNNERVGTIERLTREEEDKRLAFQRLQESRRIAALNEASQSNRTTIERNLATIARRIGESNANYDLDERNLGINEREFNRGLTVAADPLRGGDVNTLGSRSPVRVYAEKLRELATKDQQDRIDVQEEQIANDRQASNDALLDAQVAEQQRLADETAAENQRLLDYITGNNESERQVEAERAIEDTDAALLEAINNVGKVSNAVDLGPTTPVDDAVNRAPLPPAPAPVPVPVPNPNAGHNFG